MERYSENPEVRLFVEGQLHFLTGNILQPFSCFLRTFNKEVSPQKNPIQNSGNSHTQKLRRNLWEIVVQIAPCCLAFFCNYLEINFRQRIPWKLTWPAGKSPYFIGDTSSIRGTFRSIASCVAVTSTQPRSRVVLQATRSFASKTLQEGRFSGIPWAFLAILPIKTAIILCGVDQGRMQRILTIIYIRIIPNYIPITTLNVTRRTIPTPCVFLTLGFTKVNCMYFCIICIMTKGANSIGDDIFFSGGGWHLF